ncbi:MAG: hypothetical protein MOP51_3044, partial [Citricoccus sp.]|nr:hypothetical protein [Citricoccus sp. WCRC_4]
GGRPGVVRGRGAGQDRRGFGDRGDSASEHNPSDLRSANRPDRAKSPEIDEDVTGRELDRATSRELDSLDERNRPWVAKHLVMAGRLLEIDPQLSFEHALAASRRGGRLGCVREAVGLTAYAAGQYAEALREFRTYRRITGDHTHLPEMVDSERALGRHAKALELAGEVDLGNLERAVRVELVMVLSGIHRDLGDVDSALRVLQVPELDRNRGFSFSPRLFRAYADALEEAGRGGEAKEWRHQARVAERALGIGEFSDPEIVDFGVEEEVRPERRPRARDLVPPGSTGEETEEDAATSVPAAEDTEDGQPEGGRPGGDRAVGDDLAAEGLVVVDSRDDDAEGAAPWEDAEDDQPGQSPTTASRADQDPQGD